MTDKTTKIITAQNDAFRRQQNTDLIGRWVVTHGMQAEGETFVREAVAEVVRFADFTAENDPYGERDFGAFTQNGHKLFWKIDYYDTAYAMGSDNPADPAQTRRVLTLMLASEY
ncbi:DUF3768 domain-containing protein [Aestuariibius sp. 2305UL40-4]|uniref:DUF3768 domain-containing protein n=1 Tax=Aestuariibius violaceus TaxID=3234132 RepID=UPI00398EFCE8